MKINSIQNYSINTNRNPQFKGSVTPKFVNYVNVLRNDCLMIAPPKKADYINNVCNSIIAKSEQIMKICFPESSELSIDTEKNDSTDNIIIPNKILTNFFGEACMAYCGSVQKKEVAGPIHRLSQLKFWINDNLTFNEVFAKELLFIKAAVYKLKNLDDYMSNEKNFNDILSLCTWWQTHAKLLQAEAPSKMHANYVRRDDLCNKLTLELSQHIEQLKKNMIIYSLRKGLPDRTIDHLWGHLYETIGMPSPDVIYDGRMTDYEMEKFLDELLPPVVRKKNLSKTELSSLSSYNIQPIYGTENSFRGPWDYYDADIMKPYNIKEFVKADYVYEHVLGFIESNTDILVEFIKTMQKDNVYVGCPFGIKQTNYVLEINKYFNPLYKGNKNKVVNNLSLWETFQNLCDKLTPEQKKEMGWTEKFEIKLRQNLEKNIDNYIEWNKKNKRYLEEF